MQNAAITLRSLGSAFDDDTGGRAISHPLSSLLVEGCPCGADLSSAFGAPLLQGATLLTCKNAICERNQYSPKYENTAFPTLKHYPRGEGSERSETDRATREKKRLKQAMRKTVDTRIHFPSNRVQKNAAHAGCAL